MVFKNVAVAEGDNLVRTDSLALRPLSEQQHKLVNPKISEKKITLSDPAWSFYISPRFAEIEYRWNMAVPRDNLFLQGEFLQGIEESPPEGVRFMYAVFYKNEIPSGVAYCQITPFSVEASVQAKYPEKGKFPCVVRAFSLFLKNLVVGKNHNLLVCGNILLTGEHGFYFRPEADKVQAFSVLEEALSILRDYLSEDGVNIDAIFIKDVKSVHRQKAQQWVKIKFSELTFHPNMILNLSPEWEHLEDYLQAISSKYRVRAKRAFRCCAGVEKRELTAEQIRQFQPRIYELYRKITDNQDFNMVWLQEDYFYTLKMKLGNRFRVFGYFLQNHLIACYTVILNYGELEAHYLGYDTDRNREQQIYLNILFDILKLGIEEKARRIVYARTAMEIKSSVGAVAHQMFCYIRACNRIANKILPHVVEHLRPPDDWLPRNPFKHEVDF